MTSASQVLIDGFYVIMIYPATVQRIGFCRCTAIPP